MRLQRTTNFDPGRAGIIVSAWKCGIEAVPAPLVTVKVAALEDLYSMC